MKSSSSVRAITVVLILGVLCRQTAIAQGAGKVAPPMTFNDCDWDATSSGYDESDYYAAFQDSPDSACQRQASLLVSRVVSRVDVSRRFQFSKQRGETTTISLFSYPYWMPERLRESRSTMAVASLMASSSQLLGEWGDRQKQLGVDQFDRVDLLDLFCESVGTQPEELVTMCPNLRVVTLPFVGCDTEKLKLPISLNKLTVYNSRFSESKLNELISAKRLIELNLWSCRQLGEFDKISNQSSALKKLSLIYSEVSFTNTILSSTLQNLEVLRITLVPSSNVHLLSPRTLPSIEAIEVFVPANGRPSPVQVLESLKKIFPQRVNIQVITIPGDGLWSGVRVQEATK